MKLTAAIAMLAASAPLIQAWNVHVRAGDDMVDVGDLNLKEHTWEAIYAAAGNKEAVTIAPAVIEVQGGACQGDDNSKRRVTLKITGAWDDVGGNNHLGRDAMIEAGWEALTRLANQHKYNIYTNCCDDSHIGAGCLVANSVCGDKTSCHCLHTSAKVCYASTSGHKVPSAMNVYLTHNGAITANHLTFSFSSTAPEEKGGCGKLESIIKGLASFVFPSAVATLVGTGIDVACDK